MTNRFRNARTGVNRPRVYVIERDARERQRVVALLEGEGYEAVMLGSLAEALRTGAWDGDLHRLLSAAARTQNRGDA